MSTSTTITARDRVKAAIVDSKDPVSLDVIAKKSGVDKDHVSSYISGLIKSGHIERVETGIYRGAIPNPDLEELRRKILSDEMADEAKITELEPRPTFEEMSVQAEKYDHFIFAIEDLLDLVWPEGFKAAEVELVGKFKDDVLMSFVAFKAELDEKRKK